MKRRTNLNVMPRMTKSVTLTPQQFDVAWKALCFAVRWQEDAIKGTLPPAGDPNQDQLNTVEQMENCLRPMKRLWFQLQRHVSEDQLPGNGDIIIGREVWDRDVA